MATPDDEDADTTAFVVPVIGVAGLLPYCDEEAEEGGGETRPLKAFTSCGGPGVVGFADPAVPSLFVMAAGALFSRLMMVELPPPPRELLLLLLALLTAEASFPVGVELPETGCGDCWLAITAAGGVLLLAAAAAANENDNFRIGNNFKMTPSSPPLTCCRCLLLLKLIGGGE